MTQLRLRITYPAAVLGDLIMDAPVLPPLGAQPLVSVMIVNYNYERYLPEAIESVLRQTYQHFEVVICDDGSKDNSREVISRYAASDRRFKTIFKENAAVAAALNDTFRASSADIITMLDADDMFEPAKLERVVERLRPGGRIGMVMDRLTKIDSNGNRIGRIPEFGSFDRGELRDRLLGSGGSFSAAPTSGLAMRRECAQRVFPIPEKKFRTEADLYMRTMAALFYAVDVIEEPLTVYRVHSSNVTASTTVDPKWCAKSIDAGERMFSVLEPLCRENGWPIARPDESTAYWEMQVVGDYLAGANYQKIGKKAARLQRAAAGMKTDRLKSRIKAAIVGAAAMLPKPLGTKVFEQVYLPTGFKRMLSRVVQPSQ